MTTRETQRHTNTKTLQKLGITKQRDFKDFNRMFKECTGWKTVPPHIDALVKSEHRRNIIDVKLKYIRETSWSSQKKRKVNGDAGEVEGLLTVLYYESEIKRARDTTDHPGDESE